MKTKLFLLLYACLFSYSAVCQEKYVITGKSVNVRETPNQKSTIIGSVQKNDTIVVYSISDDWAEIQIVNGKAFISKSYIEKAEKVPTTEKRDNSWIFGLIIFLLLIVIVFLIVRFIYLKIRQAFRLVSMSKTKSPKYNSEFKDAEKSKQFKGKLFEVPSLTDLHTADEATILDFLNVNSKFIGAVKYLGSFIEDVKIKRETGIRAELNYVLVERKESKEKIPGQNLQKSDSSRDIFEFNYDIPDVVESQSEEEICFIPSSIETHECSKTMECSECKGSTYCKKCDGSGRNSCRECGGSGKVKKRVGSFKNGNPEYRNIDCLRCDGRGKVRCSLCNGNGKCKVCDGSGKVTCSQCKGTGYYQSFIAYSNKYKSGSLLINYSEFEDLKPILPKAQGNISFDDDLIQWKNKSEIIFDNREDAKVCNVLAPEIIDNLESFNPDSNSRIGRISAKIESIPITFIDYKFEGNEYQISIVGRNNMLCYFNIPSKHMYEQGIFNGFFQALNKEKRHIAFAYIASYMLNADDNISQSEVKLLDTFVSHIKLKQEKKQALLNDIKRKLIFDDIAPKISCVKKDRRALIFAWHCVIQDKQINKSEKEAFKQLASYFEVKDNELELLTNKATGFANLKEIEMLEEYFK
jgi:uncharacterized tellurite resistance protein B-like protein